MKPIASKPLEDLALKAATKPRSKPAFVGREIVGGDQAANF
jgi:hypothetical protein